MDPYIMDFIQPASDPNPQGPGKPEPSTSGGTPKHKAQISSPPKKSMPKKRRFNNNYKDSGKRHGGTNYAKETPNSGLLTTPVRPYFVCFTSTLGCESFVSAVHNWCVGRDFRFGSTCPVESMQYAALIAMICRLAIVNEQFGTYIDGLTSRLKAVSRSILLPEPICKMIEALGVVKRPGMPSLVPLLPIWQTYRECELYLQPEDLLQRAGRPIPPGAWAIDVPYLAEYIDHSARGESKSLGFRSIDMSTYEGRVEMLYGYRAPLFAQDTGDLIPCGPSVATQSEAELGAVYCFRDHAQRELWVHASGNHLVMPDFIGTQFTVPTLVARLAGEHLRKGQGN